MEYHHHLKKRKLALLAAATSDCSSVAEEAPVKQCPPNDIEKFLSLRKQVFKILSNFLMLDQRIFSQNVSMY